MVGEEGEEGDVLPEWWGEQMKVVGTPESLKGELSGERFVAGTHRGTKRWRGRKRKTRIDVEEPLVKMLDGVMAKEGVSDERMERALGLYEGKMKDLRTCHSLWRSLALVRRMLWGMGYDLELRVKKVKRMTPDRLLVMTNSEVELRKKRGLTDWNRGGMWKFLGLEKLYEEGD